MQPRKKIRVHQEHVHFTGPTNRRGFHLCSDLPAHSLKDVCKEWFADHQKCEITLEFRVIVGWSVGEDGFRHRFCPWRVAAAV
jgi:hypothetical protein